MAEDLISWTIQFAVSRAKTELAIKEGKIEDFIVELRRVMASMVAQGQTQIEGEIRAAIDIMARYPRLSLVEAIKVVNGGQGNPTVN
jgi:hypothetical protein